MDIYVYEAYVKIHGGCCHSYIIGMKKEWYGTLISLIPIQVKGQHIIAAGTCDDICFFEYEITKETWDKYRLG